MLRTIAERINREIPVKRKLPEEFGGFTLYITQRQAGPAPLPPFC
jgi:hypothetical protein